MAEGGRGRRNILQTLNDSELIKRNILDHEGIMFDVNLFHTLGYTHKGK